mmetsp:Transcript_33828/g.110623  ORF Transcript_33828/g.110623 Transcript_33828/m.110623 type:complete len:1662 (-) Transcript_33828:148-5133(-)
MSREFQGIPVGTDAVGGAYQAVPADSPEADAELGVVPPVEEAQAQAEEPQAEESDEDGVQLDTDSELEDEHGKPKEKRELGEWKAKLKTTGRNQETIPEDDLHIVRWAVVIKYWIINVGTFASFVAFVFVSQVGTLSLPLFLVTFLLAVMVSEFMLILKMAKKLTCGIVAALGIGAGCFVMGPFDFLHVLALWSFAPLAVIVAVLHMLENPVKMCNGGYLSSTPLYQAFMGQKCVVLWEDLEFAALLKSITHVGRTKGWTAKTCSRIRDSCGVVDSCMQVGLVSVDESQDVSDVPLCIDGEEVPPGSYVLTGLNHLPDFEAGPESDILSIKDLQTCLVRRKYISDKLLDTWINPERKTEWKAPPKTEIGAAEKKITADPLRAWVSKTQLGPTGPSAIICQFQRIVWSEGFLDHWATRAAWITIYCSIFALPPAQIFMHMDTARTQVCDIGGPHALHPIGKQYYHDKLMCDGDLKDGPESCLVVCATLLHFIAAVHDVWHISYVELLIVVVLLPVFIFTACVRTARDQHTNDVLIYLRRMRQPKNAIYEVMKIKDTFECIFRLDFLFDRFLTSWKAWSGSDDSLQSCGLITNEEFDLTATKGINDCFRQVMEPVSNMKSALCCEKTGALPFGIGCAVDSMVPPAGGWKDIFDEDDPQRAAAMEIQSKWQELKFRNDLGGADDRNYKVLIDLQIMTEDSWKLFKDVWLKKEYKEQLAYISDSSKLDTDVQDSGKECHLQDNSLVCDILLPKGFSLTHIFVQSMPEDGKPYQIEVRAYKNGLQKFNEHCDQLLALIKTAHVEDEEYDEDEDGPLMDYRLERYPINARFALSEHYYQNMSWQDIQLLCPHLTGGALSRPSFTEFVDGVLKPERFAVKTKTKTETEKKTTENEEEPSEENCLFFTEISVFMGDEHPLKALLATARRCWHAIAVYFECATLALLIPVLRYISGGEIFPSPFVFWMVCNTASIWYQLTSFLSDFHVARTRLALIGQCLSILMAQTQQPAAVATAVKKTKKEKAKEETPADSPTPGVATNAAVEPGQLSTEDAKAEARAKKKQELDTRPFDLVVEELSRDYVPSDEWWVKEWRRKGDNVQNWHMTVSYLRVFVSTSRLTAQTMLAAAAFVLLFLCGMSYVQAANGQGPPIATSFINKHTRLLLDDAYSEGQVGAHRLHGHLGEALDALADDRLAGARRLSIEEAAEEPGGSLQAATRSLREGLAPARASLLRALLRQGEALNEGQRRLREQSLSPGIAAAADAAFRRLKEESEPDFAGSKVEMAKMQAMNMIKAMDVTKATKTQIFTVVMVLFIMIYSVPLMWSIVVVNGHFDFHEDLLIKQQEQHKTFQTRRELKRTAAPSGGDKAVATPTEDQAEGAGEGEGSAGGKLDLKDPGCARYERVLAMAIKSSRKTRERFPLKLFGFVISLQLLAMWMGLAAAPILDQVKKLAPPMSLIACSWLEHSRLVQSLQQEMDDTAPGLHMNVTLMIHDNLCIPMKRFIEKKLNGMNAQMSGAIDAVHAHIQKQAARRLLAVARDSGDEDGNTISDAIAAEVAISDIQTLVRHWWRSHPGLHSEVRYATARLLLRELGREGDRLLVLAPKAVLGAFDAHASGDDAEGGYHSALGAIRPHLELALAELQDEDEGGLAFEARADGARRQRRPRDVAEL